jgi:protein-S-isoprenylcysteine O-methyltransferase Ste14
MRATTWEFKNRALIFGLIFGLGFSGYVLDPQNSAAALANWLGGPLKMDPNLVARLLFVIAACLLVAAAITRTWASSYLQSSVVYAGAVQTASLVADGPYRYVRNPLYFANVLLALGMGAMMSRAGFLLVNIAMLVFCYRLIFREESELQTAQGDLYTRYRCVVPRLWPAIHPRAGSAGRQSRWTEGFKSEFWCWGFAISVAAFAVTLSLPTFFVILSASILLLWVFTSKIEKRGARSQH